MKTKLFSLLGAALVACSFTSCEVYDSGYAYGGGYNRPYYGGGFSPFFGAGYSRPVVYGNYPRYSPSYRNRYVPASSWNNHHHHDHNRSSWNNNWRKTSGRSWSSPSSSWQNRGPSRPSSNFGRSPFGLNNRTSASVGSPFRSTNVSLRNSSSFGSSSWNRPSSGGSSFRSPSVSMGRPSGGSFNRPSGGGNRDGGSPFRGRR